MKTQKTLLVLLLVLTTLVSGFVLGGPRMAEQFAYATERGQIQATRESLAGMAQAEQLSQLFRAVVQATGPAVVEVRVTTTVEMGSRRSPFEMMPPEFRDQLPPGFEIPEPREPREFVQRGLGSGVIVDAENGYVLTNNHVVEGAEEVLVVLSDDRQFEAEWVRTDPRTDVAVLKIEPDRLIAAPLGDSSTAEVGDWVLAIGSPRGLDQTVTAGIISAKGRATNRGSDRYENYLQTDAAINRGNSGGPLVNMRGEVIGINTAIISSTGGSQGLGLSIPSNMVRHVMGQLIEHGEVVRGFLGVRIQDVTPDLAESFELSDTHGALVSGVAPTSPAEQSGLRRGDFITAIDGERIEDVNELRNRVAMMAPDSQHEFRVIRQGREQTVSVTIGAQPQDMDAAFRPGAAPPAAEEDKTEALGLTVQSLTEDLAERLGFDAARAGVVITAVKPGSAAAAAGLQPGLMILQVGDSDIETVEQFAETVEQAEAGQDLRLYVEGPDGGGLFVVLPAQE